MRLWSFVFAAVLVSTVDAAAIECPPCAPRECLHDPDFPAELEAKKKIARDHGYPERLIALFDRVAPCVRCIKTAPNGFEIKIVYRPGRRLTIGWSRHLELQVRADLRAGRIQAFYITNSDAACRCCDQPSARDRSDWNEVLEMNTDLADRFEDGRTLPPDPDDLKDPEPPPEPLPPRPPPAEAVRLAHPMCPACFALGEARNRIADEVSELRALERRRAWELQILQRVSSETYLRGMRRARNPDSHAFDAQTRRDLDGRQMDMAKLERTLAEVRRRLADAEARLAQKDRELLDCERTACQPGATTPPTPPPSNDKTSSNDRTPSNDKTPANDKTPSNKKTPSTDDAPSLPRFQVGLQLGPAFPVYNTDYQLVVGLFGGVAVTPNRLGLVFLSLQGGFLGGSTTIHLTAGFQYLIPVVVPGLFVEVRLAVGYGAQLVDGGARGTIVRHAALVVPEAGIRYALPWLSGRFRIGADVISFPISIYQGGDVTVGYRLLVFGGVAF